MKYAKFVASALFFAALASVAHAASPVLPVITNLVAVQRTGTFFVDVTYDLIDSDSPGGVYIMAEASSNNGTNYGISMRSLSGDFGLVTPGTGKKLVWNAWQDWGRNYTTNARVRLIADDFPSTITTTTGTIITRAATRPMSTARADAQATGATWPSRTRSASSTPSFRWSPSGSTRSSSGGWRRSWRWRGSRSAPGCPTRSS